MCSRRPTHKKCMCSCKPIRGDEQQYDEQPEVNVVQQADAAGEEQKQEAERGVQRARGEDSLVRYSMSMDKSC